MGGRRRGSEEGGDAVEVAADGVAEDGEVGLDPGRGDGGVIGWGRGRGVLRVVGFERVGERE